MPNQLVKVISTLSADTTTTAVNAFISNGDNTTKVKEVVSTSLVLCPWQQQGIFYAVIVTYVPQ